MLTLFVVQRKVAPHYVLLHRKCDILISKMEIWNVGLVDNAQRSLGHVSRLAELFGTSRLTKIT